MRQPGGKPRGAASCYRPPGRGRWPRDFIGPVTGQWGGEGCWFLASFTLSTGTGPGMRTNAPRTNTPRPDERRHRAATVPADLRAGRAPHRRRTKQEPIRGRAQPPTQVGPPQQLAQPFSGTRRARRRPRLIRRRLSKHHSKARLKLRHADQVDTNEASRAPNGIE